MDKTYNLVFTLGDPTRDGHCMDSTYHMVSNYSSSDIEAIYAQAIQKLGFDYCNVIGMESEDNVITVEQAEMFKNNLGIDLEDFPLCQDLDTNNFFLYEDDYLHLFEAIIKSQVPSFYMKERDLQEQTLDILEGAAYGVIGNE